MSNAQNGVKIKSMFTDKCGFGSHVHVLFVCAYMEVGGCVQRVALKDKTPFFLSCFYSSLLCLPNNIPCFKVMIMNHAHFENIFLYFFSNMTECNIIII